MIGGVSFFCVFTHLPEDDPFYWMGVLPPRRKAMFVFLSVNGEVGDTDILPVKIGQRENWSVSHTRGGGRDAAGN